MPMGFPSSRALPDPHASLLNLPMVGKAAPRHRKRWHPMARSGWMRVTTAGGSTFRAWMPGCRFGERTDARGPECCPGKRAPVLPGALPGPYGSLMSKADLTVDCPDSLTVAAAPRRALHKEKGAPAPFPPPLTPQGQPSRRSTTRNAGRQCTTRYFVAFRPGERTRWISPPASMRARAVHTDRRL